MRGLRVIIASALAVGCAAPALAQNSGPARILVMPFEVKREASIFWLGEGAAVLLVDDLDAAGASAIARDERREAFEKLQVPPKASLTDATIIRIGQLVGASEVITGSLQLEGETLVVHVRGLVLDSARITHDEVERGPMSEVFAIFERVARHFVPATAMSRRGSPPPPLRVFENYIKGLLADTPANARSFLQAALTGLPTFDRARLALWDVYVEQGDHTQALAAVAPIPADSAFFRRGRFLAGLSFLTLKKYDEAFTAFKALADGEVSSAVLNNLGVVQLRRGGTTQTGQPTYYFNKAIDADPNDPDISFNLGYAYWLARDHAAAIYWLREAVRRNPADGDAHFILGASLAALGSPVEATRERELARRLSSTYEQWEKRPAADAVPKGLERVKARVTLPHAQVESTLATNGQRDQAELAQFYFDRGRRQFQQENDREAITELNRALYLSPYDAEAHLLVGRIHLRNHRLHEAIDAFKISLWSSETPAAHLALADAYLENKDADAARAEVTRVLAGDPASQEARQLLTRIDAR